MLMLMDKGYYDYDYEKPKEKKRKLTKEEREVWSDEKVLSILGRALTSDGKRVFADSKPMTAEDMQRIAMAEAAERENKQ